MGSSTKTVTNFDILPLSTTVGEMHKNILLESSKSIPNGMRGVINLYGGSISKVRNLYNRGFLKAMGYDLSQNLGTEAVDKNKLDLWAQTYLNATSVDSYSVRLLSISDVAIKYLQDTYTDFSYTDRTFVDDGKTYTYRNSISNGPYIDILASMSAYDTGVLFAESLNDYFPPEYEPAVKVGPWYLDSYNPDIITSQNQQYYEITVSRSYRSVRKPTNDEVDMHISDLSGWVVHSYPTDTYTSNGNYAIWDFLIVEVATGNIDSATITTYLGNVQQVSETYNAPVQYKYLQVNDPYYTKAQTIVDSYSGFGVAVVTVRLSYKVYIFIDSDGYKTYSGRTKKKLDSHVKTYYPGWNVYQYSKLQFEGHTQATYEYKITRTYYNTTTPTIELTPAGGDTLVTQITSTAVASVTHLGGLQFHITYDSTDSRAKTACAAVITPEINQEVAVFGERLVFLWSKDGVQKLYYNDKIYFGDVFKNYDLDSYPIIPLKENGVFNVDTKRREMVLKQVGVSGEDFDDSLGDTRLNSAYILFGVPITNTSKYVTKLVFESLLEFHNGVSGSNSAKVTYSNLTVSRSSSVTITTKTGVIGDVGTYTHHTTYVIKQELVRDPENGDYYKDVIYNYRVYRKQISLTQYQEIFLDGISVEYTAADFNFSVGILDSRCLIFITRRTLRKINFKDTCNILDIGIQIVYFTRESYKVNYTKKLLSVIFLIVAVIVTIKTLGGTSSLLVKAMALLNLAAQIAGFMGIDTGTAGKVLAVAGAMYGGYAAITQQGIVSLASANALVNLTSMVHSLYLTRNLESLEREFSKTASANKKAQEELQELIDKLGKPLMLPYQNNYDEIDGYYTIANGDLQYSFDMLYDYSILFNENQIQT